MEINIERLKSLREPFPPKLISKLPKGTKAQNQCPASEKVNCKVCGGWHHPKIAHLDYVGHAALTDRLLDVDPLWSWNPMGFMDNGTPAFDKSGGLWIELTVCGVTRLGYGHAEISKYKEIGSREKEVIGDAIRNAAMRFGAALDLWHKGDLYGIKEGLDAEKEAANTNKKTADELISELQETTSVSHKDNWKKKHLSEILALDKTNRERVIAAGVKHTEKLNTEFKERLGEEIDGIEDICTAYPELFAKAKKAAGLETIETLAHCKKFMDAYGALEGEGV